VRIIRKFIVLLILCYQKTLSQIIGPRCRFYPSCSEYAKIAFATHSLPRAIWLSMKRLLKCHPWHQGGLDLVPEKEKA
jgi:uncharacterized protein